MDERSKDEVVGRDGVSRRSMLKGMGAGAAIAWSAPVLQSIASPAFAQYGPDPECAPASCGTFVPCGAGGDCVCVSCVDGGGACIPGSTSCASLDPCRQQSDCPADSCCSLNTCCGGDPGVCIPFSLRDTCVAGGPAPRRVGARGATVARR